MIQLSPSMMCADFLHLERDIRTLERHHVDYLHIDIMDGHFVPNFTLGPDYVKALRQSTSIPMDLHLMVDRPLEHIASFQPQARDLVVIHVETDLHPLRTLSCITDMGAAAGIALNPGTPLSAIEELLPYVNVVLIMTVNPGYAGQKMVASTLDKIRRLRDIIIMRNLPIQIEVDGNVNLPNGRKMRDAGASLFVVGSSGIFLPDIALGEAIEQFRTGMMEP